MVTGAYLQNRNFGVGRGQHSYHTGIRVRGLAEIGISSHRVRVLLNTSTFKENETRQPTENPTPTVGLLSCVPIVGGSMTRVGRYSEQLRHITVIMHKTQHYSVRNMGNMTSNRLLAQHRALASTWAGKSNTYHSPHSTSV